MQIEDQETNDAVKSLFEGSIPEEEMLADYVLIAGTRNIDGGGGTYIICSQGPAWSMEGILRRGLKILEQSSDDD